MQLHHKMPDFSSNCFVCNAATTSATNCCGKMMCTSCYHKRSTCPDCNNKRQFNERLVAKSHFVNDKYYCACGAVGNQRCWNSHFNTHKPYVAPKPSYDKPPALIYSIPGQDNNAIAITRQGNNAIAIGKNAIAITGQGNNAIAIGNNAIAITNAIAICSALTKQGQAGVRISLFAYASAYAS